MGVLGLNGINTNSYCNTRQQKRTQQGKFENKNGSNFDLGSCSNQKKQYNVFLKTDNMLYSGGNGTGLTFYIKYADDTTDENPIVIAKEYTNIEMPLSKKFISIKDMNTLGRYDLSAFYVRQLILNHQRKNRNSRLLL